MGKESSTPSRVVLHVGAPKSGTTFLQKALWSNREGLAADGFALPGERQRAMFLAAVEVRQGHKFWGYPPEQIDGTWSRLCRAAHEHQGTTVMSHELLGACTDDQVRGALAELDGLDLHVVFTARDLARQATSEWQERIKNGSTRTFKRFQRQLVQQIKDGDFSSGFWRNQDVVGVLDRWAGHLPTSHVHVVVAPPPGSDPRLLWRRFATAVGFDPEAHDPITSEAPTNQTLGSAQVAVLRRVNETLAGRIPQPAYARVVKDQFAGQVLGSQSSAAPVCPFPLAQRLRAVAEERNAALVDLGYQVHGELSELLPEPDRSAVHPDEIPGEAADEAYVRAISDMLVHRAEQRTQGILRRKAEERAVTAPPPLRRRVLDRLRRRS